MSASRHDDGRLVNIWDYEPARWGEVEAGSPRVVLRFAEVDGRLVCANVEVGVDFENPDEHDPTPITTGVWRSVNVSRLVDEALLSAVRTLRAASTFEGAGETAQRRLPQVEAALKRKKVGRPPKWTAEELEEVSRVYREHSGGRSPRKAVAKHFHLSDSGAAKVIARARALGLDLGRPA
jgi:hypothetical protein